MDEALRPQMSSPKQKCRWDMSENDEVGESHQIFNGISELPSPLRSFSKAFSRLIDGKVCVCVVCAMRSAQLASSPKNSTSRLLDRDLLSSPMAMTNNSSSPTRSTSVPPAIAMIDEKLEELARFESKLLDLEELSDLPPPNPRPMTAAAEAVSLDTAEVVGGIDITDMWHRWSLPEDHFLKVIFISDQRDLFFFFSLLFLVRMLSSRKHREQQHFANQRKTRNRRSWK